MSYLLREKDKRKHKKKVLYTEKFSKMKKALKAKREALRRLRNREKKRNILNMRKKTSQEQVLQAVQPLLTPDEHLLLRTQLSNKVRRRNVYTDDFKKFVISIAFRYNN